MQNSVFILSLAPSLSPSNLRATNVTQTTVTLEWDPVTCLQQNGPTTGYDVEVGINDSVFFATRSIQGGDRTHVETGLQSYTAYYFRVSSRTGDSLVSLPSPTLRVLTDTCELLDHIL